MQDANTTITNDQGLLIEHLKQQNYLAAWEIVKFVGYTTVRDINERYIIFTKAAREFDYNKNNNFILFYKNRLGFYRFDRNSTFKITDSPKMVKDLKNMSISPCYITKDNLLKELMNWSTGANLDD